MTAPSLLSDDPRAAQALLAAIVETSQDAIVSKTLDGVITCAPQGLAPR